MNSRRRIAAPRLRGGIVSIQISELKGPLRTMSGHLVGSDDVEQFAQIKDLDSR
jgi:hypothetical protein